MKKKKLRTIRFHIGVYYGTFVVALLTAVFVIVFYMAIKNETDNVKDYGESLLRQTSESIDSKLQKYEMGLGIVNNNALLQKFAQEDHQKDNGKGAMNLYRDSDMYNVIMDITVTVEDVDSTGIFTETGAEGYFLGNASEEIEEEYLQFVHHEFQTLKDKRGAVCWAGPVEFQGNQTILAMRNIIDNQNLDILGGLVFHINQSKMNQILRETELGRGKAVFITDQDGSLISASNQSLYETWSKGSGNKVDYKQKKITCGQKDYLMVSCQSELTGWNIVGLIPLKAMQEQLFHTRIVIAVIAVLGILLAIMIAFVLAGHLAKPIERLRISMQEAPQKENLNVFYEDDTFYETRELGKSFVTMLHDIDELAIRNRESELREKEAQLSALQSQVNPHFLYNTLNTINYMLVLEEKPEIGKLVVNLGELLRSSIEESRKMITLDEELSLVEKYLYIQKARFEEKVNYVIRVSEEAEKCMVIRLLLQPLIENSIIHGFEKKGGTIWISGEIDVVTNHLVITVEDNGQGMSEEQKATILIEKKPEKNERKHIGVANVNKRIQLFYGDEYGLQIESRKNEGTRIRIEIPRQGEMEDEDADSDC